MDAKLPKPSSEGRASSDKPKMSEGLEPRESVSGANRPSDGAPSSASPALAKRAKDAGANLSETARDVKDVAKAGPTGLESTGKEIKEGAEKAKAEGKSATKGAAAAAGREAAGQAAATAVDVASFGATTAVHGKIAKAVSKGLKKENLKKILLSLGLIIATPMAIILLVAAIILNFAHNPFKFVWHVLTDSKIREFSVQSALAVGGWVFSENTYKKYGYVDKKAGAAIAAPITATPKPGSLEEKILKINLKNARYQYDAPTCPYTYTTKELVGPNGQTVTVVDKVKNEKGEVVASDNFMGNFCIAQSMPLYNMMFRTQGSRDVNNYSNTILNYAAPADSTAVKNQKPEVVDKYVYKKTYDRITSKESDDPKTKIDSVNNYIAQVREALANNKDPNKVAYEFRGDPNDINNITKTLCTFTQGYLSPQQDNIRKGIFSRINSAERSAIKWGTLAATRDVGGVSNEEASATFKQIEGWNTSRAYFQSVYGTQSGEAIDPERLGNTSYGANYVDSMSLLYELQNRCESLNDSNFITDFLSSIFGGQSSSDKEAQIRAIYTALKEIIVAQSNGKFNSINDFGVEQLMVGIIRMGGGSAVSGLEAGSQNFNNQAQGFRALSNQYLMKMGGRFLTNAEYSAMNALSENTRREMLRKNGIAYRLFGSENVSSLANIVQYEAPRTPSEFSLKTRQAVAYLSNPIKLLADVHSGFSYIATGKINLAYAADNTGDAYMRLDSVGLTKDDFKGVDLIQNSDYIQDKIQNGNPNEKAVLSYFDKCANSNIPTKNVFARLYKVKYNSDNTDATVDSRNLIYSDGQINGVSVPKYNSLNDSPAVLGFSNQKELIACEIYLLPNNGETVRDYISNGKQTAIYGFDIVDLAKKYHLYLYANKLADLMDQLSSTERTDSIYSNPSAANANSKVSQ